MKNLVIVGGGFAGVWAAIAAARARSQFTNRRSDFAITLVSRDGWLTVRPRLYESFLDGVRVPLDTVTAPLGVRRVEGEVTRIDTHARTIVAMGAAGPRTVPYDRLVLAAGSRLRRSEIPGAEHAFTVDTYADATALDRHLRALPDLSDASARLTAVVVGAGFTGIEAATELVTRLGAIAAHAGLSDRPRLVVVERAPVLAPDLGDGARGHVEQAFAALGIESRIATSVEAIEPNAVRLSSGERIAAATTLWTGGFRASDLTSQLAVPRDDLGRLPVDEFLRVCDVTGVYAAGDVARVTVEGDRVTPMSCQYAIPLGERAGANAAADLLGASPAKFVAERYVTCLDLGEAGALFMEGWDRQVKLTGFWAKTMKQTINTRLIYPPRRVLRAAA